MKVKITSFILLFSLLFGVVVPVEGKLTENGKKWIAQNLGKKIGDKYCYSYDVEYYRYDSDLKQEVKETYGTGGAVGALVGAKLIGKEDEIYVRIGDKRFYYSDLKAGNDGYDITLDDVKYEIVPYDGYPAGEDQYCYAPETLTPTPTQSPTPITPLTTTKAITQTETIPSTPGFEAILTAIIILLVLVTKRY